MSSPLPPLTHRFADELHELATPWSAEAAPAPAVVLVNDALARDLGIDPAALRSSDGARALVGNELPEGARPVAQVYAGHQFGGFSPRLGDGRALLLGELEASALAGPGGVVDLHLKGSGRTPFARGGDGRAVLGPMLREYVISEAMHALGVPSTRALAVTATGAVVQRDQPEAGAVLARVAASHLRVGSFQFVRAAGDEQLLRRLADHAIARHHPEAADAEAPYLALFEAVVRAQADLVARWMLIGFVHGVMNTDNMTISGETIDYGPCAFIDAFDPATVFSSIDHQGRYAYGNQPAIAQWNLARLAESLLPLLADDEKEAIARATAVLDDYPRHYAEAWAQGMRAKLGLPAGFGERETIDLATDLLEILHAGGVDFTGAFRDLIAAAQGDAEPLRGRVLDLPALDGWLERWRATGPDPAPMRAANPVYIPRNHLVEEALAAAAADDLEPLHALLEVLSAPFDEQPGRQRYAEADPAASEGFQTYCGT